LNFGISPDPQFLPVGVKKGNKLKVNLLLATMRPLESGLYAKILRWIDETSNVEVPVFLVRGQDFDACRSVFRESVFFDRGLGDWPVASLGPSSPEAVRKLTALTTGADFPAFQAHVYQMLNRHDTSGTFRLVDREMYFWANFFGLGGEIVDKNITHLFFDITPHVATEYIAFWVGKKLGRATLFLQPVPWAGIAIPRGDVGALLPVAEGVWEGHGAAAFSPLVQRSAEGLVRSLSEGKPEWVRRYQKPELAKLDSPRAGWLKLVRSFLGSGRKGNSIHFSGLLISENWLFDFFSSFLRWALRRDFLKTRTEILNAGLPTQPFLFMALTHEPERTFMPEALPWASQLLVILKASLLLSQSQSLVVKEHETQYVPGRNGFASRSRHFYNTVSLIPKVSLLSSRMSAGELIVASEGVISATGTICIEAAIKGIPSYYYGNPWWEGFPGTKRIFSDSGPQKHLVPADKFTSESFRDYAQLLIEKSIPSTSNVETETFRKKFADLPSDFEALEVESLIKQLLLFFEDETPEQVPFKQ